jgi:hypothetical protein
MVPLWKSQRQARAREAAPALSPEYAMVNPEYCTTGFVRHLKCTHGVVERNVSGTLLERLPEALNSTGCERQFAKDSDLQPKPCGAPLMHRSFSRRVQ